MNVLLIPEDFRKDQFVLKPIVQAIFAAAGKPHANVQTCMDPLLGGIDQAMSWERLDEIIDQYKGMVHLFLLLVDRDGEKTRRAALDALEARAAAKLSADRFYGEHAWQEIEVWAIAGLDLPRGWSWADVRTHRDPKEAYFAPLARQHGVDQEPGEGRKTLAKLSSQNYARIRARCPEDVGALEERLKRKFGTPI